MNALLQFIADPSNGYLQHTVDYIKLCAVAIVLAIVISVPLGVLVVRSPVASFIAINFSGLLRAIPILAVLVAFYPILGGTYHPGYSTYPPQYLYRNSRY